MLQIKAGHTRVVVLCGQSAYKIARTKFIKTLFKVMKTLCIKSEMNRLSKKHGRKALHKILFECFIGFHSNRAEAAYWKRTQDVRCVPVVSVWLGGLILVQERAMKVSATQLHASPAHALTADMELSNARQFGFHGGEVRIVDYAHWGLHT